MSYTNGLDKPSDYFVTKLYAGNGGTNAQTGVGFAPNWVWIKNRSGADNNALYDTIRGANKVIVSNNTNAEGSQSDGLTAFGTDGFTVGADGAVNTNGNNFVAWNWKAGTSFTNDASGTGIGSIDSAGSVNQDAGFSICSYTGAGGVITVKHGLSTVPQVIITKNRDDANHWAVFHHKNTSVPETDFLKLSDTAATTDDGDIWNDTAPTSAIFTAGDHSSSNRSGDAMVAYLFSEVKGYSKFGSYTGNGNADGTFVYTGFKPAWIMVKCTTTANSYDHWVIYDNKRLGYNIAGNRKIYANSNAAEAGDDDLLDILSNGFKFRNTHSNVNGSGQTFIYMCFAENPFVTSTGVPATAR